jgi:hypothetical protein
MHQFGPAYIVDAEGGKESLLARSFPTITIAPPAASSRVEKDPHVPSWYVDAGLPRGGFRAGKAPSFGTQQSEKE